jgi:hypothetical protein
MVFISGDRAHVRRQEQLHRQEKLFKSQQQVCRQSPQPHVRPQVDVEASVAPVVLTTQTYPEPQSRVVRQHNDLTCGMRVLQNLYSKYIVTREEMDQKSMVLETMSNGIPMYDQKLGYYSIEVLQSILEDKGKFVQRIALDKMSQEYFEPTIASNPDFVGYVVAVGLGSMKHYVALRYSDGAYTIVDSLSSATRTVSSKSIFQRRSDNHIYCSQESGETRPVVAAVAVGGSHFIEYNILHDTWSPTRTQVPPSMIISVICHSLSPPSKSFTRQLKKTPPHVQQWFATLRTARTPPPDNCLPFLQNLLDSKTATVPIHVKMSDHQTIVHCRGVTDLLQNLHELGWISETQPFYLMQQERCLCTLDGDDIQMHSIGSFDDYSLDSSQPITLLSNGHRPTQADVGGFYTFQSAVTGECVDNKYNAYSVRDKNGAVHVIYKQTVQTIT